jgi:hypothetical protein
MGAALVIKKAHGAIASRLPPGRPPPTFVLTFGRLAALQGNHPPRLKAGGIREVRLEGILAARRPGNGLEAAAMAHRFSGLAPEPERFVGRAACVKKMPELLSGQR